MCEDKHFYLFQQKIMQIFSMSGHKGMTKCRKRFSLLPICVPVSLEYVL